MKKNKLSDLSLEQLEKRKKTLRGAIICFSAFLLIIYAILIYLLILKGFNQKSILAIIPMITLPITFLPLLISIIMINKEIQIRKFK